MLFVICSFIVLIACNRTTNEITDLELIANKISSHQSYIAFQEFNFSIFQEFIINHQNSLEKGMSKKFLESTGHQDINSLSEFINQKYNELFANIFRDIPQLNTLREQDLKEVFHLAREINASVRKRHSTWVECMEEAWEAYDIHTTDTCIPYYQNNGNWGNCLTVALNNYIFNTDSCTLTYCNTCE